MRALFLRKIKVLIGPVRVEEFAVVANRFPRVNALAQVSAHFLACRRQRNSLLLRLLGSRRLFGLRRPCLRLLRRQPIPRPSPPFAFRDQTPLIDEISEPVLQGAVRNPLRERPGDIAETRTFGILRDSSLDGRQGFFRNSGRHGVSFLLRIQDLCAIKPCLYATINTYEQLNKTYTQQQKVMLAYRIRRAISVKSGLGFDGVL